MLPFTRITTNIICLQRFQLFGICFHRHYARKVDSRRWDKHFYFFLCPTNRAAREVGSKELIIVGDISLKTNPLRHWMNMHCIAFFEANFSFREYKVLKLYSSLCFHYPIGQSATDCKQQWHQLDWVEFILVVYESSNVQGDRWLSMGIATLTSYIRPFDSETHKYTIACCFHLSY